MYYSDYSSYASNSSYGTETAGIFAGAFLAIYIIMLIISLVACVLVILALAKIFKENGKPAWAAIIPIYNFIVFCTYSSLVQCLFNACSALVQCLFNTCSAPVLHAFDVCGMGAESLTPFFVVLPRSGFVFPQSGGSRTTFAANGLKAQRAHSPGQVSAANDTPGHV